MVLVILAVIVVLLSFTLVASPRFAWYYLLSGHWGRNEMGAPSSGQLLVVQALGTISILAICWLAQR